MTRAAPAGAEVPVEASLAIRSAREGDARPSAGGWALDHIDFDLFVGEQRVPDVFLASMGARRPAWRRSARGRPSSRALSHGFEQAWGGTSTPAAKPPAPLEAVRFHVASHTVVFGVLRPVTRGRVLGTGRNPRPNAGCCGRVLGSSGTERILRVVQQTSVHRTCHRGQREYALPLPPGARRITLTCVDRAAEAANPRRLGGLTVRPRDQASKNVTVPSSRS